MTIVLRDVRQLNYAGRASAIVAGEVAFVERANLGAIEFQDRGAYTEVVDVQYSQCCADFDDGFDAHVVLAVKLGIAGEGLQFGAGVGEVVAVGVDDRGAQGAVVAAGDKEVDLQ